MARIDELFWKHGDTKAQRHRVIFTFLLYGRCISRKGVLPQRRGGAGVISRKGAKGGTQRSQGTLRQGGEGIYFSQRRNGAKEMVTAEAGRRRGNTMSCFSSPNPGGIQYE